MSSTPTLGGAEANLFTAARAQLVKEVILPHLARGYIVVADRYADSTLAYQGAGRGLEVAILSAMQAVLKLRPDLTLRLLDLDPAAGFERQAAAGGTPDRMESGGAGLPPASAPGLPRLRGQGG